MSGLGYRWHASGTHSTRDPQPGMLWPFEHEVYRIIEVNAVPEDLWTEGDHATWRAAPKMVVVRPARIVGGDVRDRDHDRHFRMGGERAGSLDVYGDEHYPVCAECAEPLPCREQMAERVSAAEAERMARYDTAGVCPACCEVVTNRQASQTWPDNAVVFLGPPVTFHLRGRCLYSAAEYEKQWAKSDPERRRTTLSCKGSVINHNDGTYQCSELTECPGPRARHRGYTICRCPDCHAAGQFGCMPNPKSRNQALDAS